jgi:hypothetical protein
MNGPMISMPALTAALSRERLSKYRQAGDPDAMVLARYAWNHAISDAMNLPLHIFEVTLRNTIDRVGRSIAGPITSHGGVPSWLDAQPSLLAPAHVASTTEARENLRKRGAPRTPGRLVAEMSLGFWVLLFGSYYDQGAGRHGRLGFQLWTATNLRSAFPNLGSGRDREKIRKEFDAIRLYRNRIAHHEPIFDLKPLARYAEIARAIRWMSADAAEYVNALETVRAVVAAGPVAFLGRCESLLA